MVSCANILHVPLANIATSTVTASNDRNADNRITNYGIK